MSEYDDNVQHEIARRAKVCVNFHPLEAYRSGGRVCDRDVPVEKKAIAANGGSRFGIALRLPCNGIDDPLFRCPWYDAYGIDRAADEMRKLREAGARTIRRLAKELKKKAEAN
jgi:hypothetical protein